MGCMHAQQATRGAWSAPVSVSHRPSNSHRGSRLLPCHTSTPGAWWCCPARSTASMPRLPDRRCLHHSVLHRRHPHAAHGATLTISLLPSLPDPRSQGGWWWCPARVLTWRERSGAAPWGSTSRRSTQTPAAGPWSAGSTPTGCAAPGSRRCQRGGSGGRGHSSKLQARAAAWQQACRLRVRVLMVSGEAQGQRLRS